jgi:hypothetical protein
VDEWAACVDDEGIDENHEQTKPKDKKSRMVKAYSRKRETKRRPKHDKN